MKKIVKLGLAILSLSALTSLAYATNPGAYAGLGLGYSKLDTPNDVFIDTVAGYPVHESRNVGGLGGRIFGGYNFNQYFGIEAGFAQYAQSKYKGNLNTIIGSANETIKYNMNALDLVGKGYLPLGESGFNLYALGGVAYVHSRVKDSYSTNFPGIVVGHGSYSKVENKFRPVYGVGASYDIPNTQLTTNLEVSRIQGVGNVKKSPSAIPNADMVTLNLSYNFG